MGKQAEEMLLSLKATLEKDDEQREELVNKIKAIVVFDIDGDKWTLDLRPDHGSLEKGEASEDAALTLTMNEATFINLVLGKTSPQTAFIMRKLKINGSMALAMKTQAILDAAAPKAKL